jgi:hypothetical protein
MNFMRTRVPRRHLRITTTSVVDFWKQATVGMRLSYWTCGPHMELLLGFSENRPMLEWGIDEGDSSLQNSAEFMAVMVGLWQSSSGCRTGHAGP